MDKQRFEHFKEEAEHMGDPEHRGFRHTIWFKILCGFLVLLFLGCMYSLLFGGGKENAMSDEEQQEEARRKAELDTLDVVGNYLFPNDRPRKKDSTKVDDKAQREAAEAEAKAKAEAERLAKEAEETEGENADVEIGGTEADPSASATPTTPEIPAAKPKIEKLSTPKATPLETGK